MPNPSLDSLPQEIHQLIFDRLPQHDLTQCALVSRSWSVVFSPQVWKTVSVITRRAYLLFQSPEAQAALVRNAHHVRDLTTIYFRVVESLFRPLPVTNALPILEQPLDSPPLGEPLTACICSNLVRLDLERFWRTPLPIVHSGKIRSINYGLLLTYSLDLTPDQEQLIRQVIQSNPHLRALIIGPFMLHQDAIFKVISDTSLPHLQELYLGTGRHRASTISLPRLQDLYLGTGRHRASTVSASLAEAKRFLENCPRALRELTVYFTFRLKQDGMAFEKSSSSPCLPHRCIKSLSIHTLDVNCTRLDALVLPFLKSCDKATVKKAHIHVQGGYSDLISSALTDLGISPMKKLSFEREFYISDEDAAGLLAAESDWTNICLGGPNEYEPDGSRTVETLLERCGHLESLKIHSCEIPISSHQLQQILCRSPCLLFLDATVRWMYESENWNAILLDAKDVIQAPWACSRMTHLKIQIGKVPRPDIKVDHHGFPVKGKLFSGTTVEESHRIQRQIYEQLARMTSLVELQLGGECWNSDEYISYSYYGTHDAQGRYRYVDPIFQLNCLEMSLASGLGLLSGLKEMRSLDVTRMAHRLGIRELEWMQRNWPKLGRLSGLFDPWYRLEPGVREWLIEEDPIWGAEYFRSHYTFNKSGTCGSAVIKCDQDD